MADEEFVSAVREAAKELCRKIEAACEAGLVLEVSVKHHGAIFKGDRMIQQNTWRPYVAARREINL